MLKAFIQVLVGVWGLIINLFSSIIDLFTDKYGRLNFFGFILYPFIIMTIIELVLDIIFDAREIYFDFFDNDKEEEEEETKVIKIDNSKLLDTIKKEDILEAEIIEKGVEKNV